MRVVKSLHKRVHLLVAQSQYSNHIFRALHFIPFGIEYDEWLQFCIRKQLTQTTHSLENTNQFFPSLLQLTSTIMHTTRS